MRNGLPGIAEYFNSMIYPRHPRLGYFNEDDANPGKVVCPFHDDLNPSMGIVPDSEVFHCFGCRASGNVVTLHRRYLEKYHSVKMSYKDALQDLIETFDVDPSSIPDPSSRGSVLMNATSKSARRVVEFQSELYKARDRVEWSNIIRKYSYAG